MPEETPLSAWHEVFKLALVDYIGTIIRCSAEGLDQEATDKAVVDKYDTLVEVAREYPRIIIEDI